jgi:hypothetical protein
MRRGFARILLRDRYLHQFPPFLYTRAGGWQCVALRKYQARQEARITSIRTTPIAHKCFQRKSGKSIFQKLYHRFVDNADMSITDMSFCGAPMRHPQTDLLITYRYLGPDTPPSEKPVMIGCIADKRSTNIQNI